MKRVCKINKTVLVMMTLAAVAIALKAPAAWSQGVSPVVWGASPVSFDNGQAPSVAVSGWFAVEVHEGASGTLWYSTGQIQGSTVVWTVSSQLPTDMLPRSPSAATL
jgi:hypothetical protein